MSEASGPWINTVRALVALVEASDAEEVEVEIGGFRVAIRRSFHLEPPEEFAKVVAADDGAGSLHLVRCPITGIWYDSPAPGASPFVRTGDAVAVGSVIGLVETMKVFNEVQSDAAGTVRQVLVHRGELVPAQAPLIAVEASGGLGMPSPEGS